jgi:5-methylcytosine-specific restriction endonuclease McrA
MTTVGSQDTVRCAACNRHCYNAPRSETGRPTRSLRTRPTIKPSQRARILLRDNATCVICHRANVPLDLGHLISVHDGPAFGLTEPELFSDENLAAMCDSCNSGLSSATVPLRFLAAALLARLKNIPDEPTTE